MAKAKGPQRIEKTVELLRAWQALERDAVNTTAEIMETTDNALVRQIMEIIRNDSVQHHRVQQFIIDHLTRKAVQLQPADLAEIWAKIEAHDEVERKTIELAKELRETCVDPVTRIILDYLIVDEQKHDTIIGQLEELKRHLSKLS